MIKDGAKKWQVKKTDTGLSRRKFIAGTGAAMAGASGIWCVAAWPPRSSETTQKMGKVDGRSYCRHRLCRIGGSDRGP